MKIGTTYLHWANKRQILDDASAKAIATMMVDLRKLDKVKRDYDDYVSELTDEEISAALGITNSGNASNR